MSTLTSPCIVCAEPMRVFPTSADPERMIHRACRGRSGDSPGNTECPNCGVKFKPAKKSGGILVATCSKSCAMKLRYSQGLHHFHRGVALSEDERKERARVRDERKRRARRARLAGVPSEPYTTGLIAERDGFVCSLCGQPVDVSLKFPDPMSASVDHVLPISKGGDDTLSNVALAHLGCNSRKSNKV